MILSYTISKLAHCDRMSSVCNVGGLWSHRLEMETNCTDN